MLLRKYPFILSFLTRYFYFFRDILYLFRLKRLPIFAIQVIGFVPEVCKRLTSCQDLIRRIENRIVSKVENFLVWYPVCRDTQN